MRKGRPQGKIGIMEPHSHGLPKQPGRLTFAELQASLPQAILIAADHFHFSAGMSTHSTRVGSRRLFWCRGGWGTVRVNGELHAMAPGHFLFMPWHHEVLYQAPARGRFDIGSVHLIPEQAPGAPLRFGFVPHNTFEKPLPDRRPLPIPALPGAALGVTMKGHFDLHRSLGMLAEYAVRTYRARPEESLMRLLAQQVFYELHLAFVGKAAALPPALEEALAFLERREGDVDLAALADVMKVSISTTVRLFKRHLGMPPRKYLLDRRITRARELLLESTLSIQEVGEAVGIPQPHYFSRLFKARCGMSPSQCRGEGSYV